MPSEKVSSREHALSILCLLRNDDDAWEDMMDWAARSSASVGEEEFTRAMITAGCVLTYVFATDPNNESEKEEMMFRDYIAKIIELVRGE